MGTPSQLATGAPETPALRLTLPLFGGTTTTGALQSGAVGTAGEAMVSGGSGAIGLYSDLWIAEKVVTANCDNATASTGLSLPTSAAPTAFCRTGTNLQAGYLQFSASQSAQWQDEVPGDWDSSNGLCARELYAERGATGSQTIAFEVATGCSTTTDDPSFQSYQTFTTTTTGSTANTQYTQTLQLNSTSMTNCAAGKIINFKVATTASWNATSNLQLVTVTWPHLSIGTKEAN